MWDPGSPVKPLRPVRRIRGTQRVQMSGVEFRAEGLAGLAHPGGNRAAPLHRGQGIDCLEWLRYAASIVGDLLIQPLHEAVPATLSSRGDDVVAPSRSPARSLCQNPLNRIS